MAKAIDLPITGLESDKSWERYKGSRVREYLQKKVGAFYRPNKRQGDNAYHLLGFETEETKADWLKRWQAAVDANDDAAMSALWTDKLVIQDTSLGGDTDAQISVELSTDSNQSGITSIDGNLKLKLKFTSIEYNLVTKKTKDTGESATLKIEKRAASSDEWTEVIITTIPSIGINDINKFTEIDLSKKLTNGVWQLRCIATGQNTKITTSAVIFNSVVISTKLELIPAMQWWIPNTTNNVTLSYYINGDAAKTLNYEVTNKNGIIETKGSIPIGIIVYKDSPKDFTVRNLTHGIHNVKAWLTIDGTTTKSDEVNTQIMVVTDYMSKDILVAVNDVAKSVTNYVQSSIFKFAVYNPNADDTKIKFDATNNSKTETYISSFGNYKNNTKVEYKTAFNIESRDKNIDAYIHIYDDSNEELINPISVNIDNSENLLPTENADFILNPNLRSNNENHPDTIINAANGDIVNSGFFSFDFKSDGWVSDRNGIKCLRVPDGTEIDIDYNPFSAFTNSGNNTASMTMEFDIATRNVLDEDAAVLKVCSYDTNNNPLGFRLKPLEACFMTANLQNKQDQNIMFQDETRTHIAVNIVHNLANSGINYIRIFINGIINREMQYSSSDSFVQHVDGFDTTPNIGIGATGADIDIYGIRIYKRELSESQIRQDYMSSLDNIEDKLAFRNANDILGDSKLIDYNKTFEKYNTILWTGTLPSYANKANTKGDIKIHIIGDPAHSGEMKNVEIKGQDNSKSYWKWDQQFSTSYKDEKGNEVKTDWVDENGTSHGAVYQLEDGLPLATKLAWKLNWASPQQSHNIGSVNLFTDLWKNIVGNNGITNYTDEDGSKPYANCRVSTIQKPFMLFTRATKNSQPVFYGLVTFGPDKTDNATFGFNKDVFPNLCVLEGSDNDRPLTEFRVPWMLDEVTYNETEGAYQYNGENQFNVVAGNKNSVEKYFVPAFNFVFLHNFNISYFIGTYEDLVASKGTDKMKQYWVTDDSADSSHHKYDLFRWDYITNTWVNASTIKTNNVYDVFNISTQIDIDESVDDNRRINFKLLQQRIEDFNRSVDHYFNLADLMYSMQFLKLIGASNNGSKNTYLYVDPTTLKICFMQNNMNAILNTNNIGRNNKPYYVEEQDLDNSGNSYWSGRNNVLYNNIEAMAFSRSDDFIATMNSILTYMAILGDGSVFDCMYKYYFSVQEYFPAIAYNETAKLLYEDANVHYNNGSYTSSIAPLSQSLGDQLQAELEWWNRREIYMSSYARYGAFSVKDGKVNDAYNSNTLAFEAADGDSSAYSFTVVPTIWLYPSFASGAYEVNGNTRVKAGERWVSDYLIPGEKNTYIRGINYFKDIGVFSDKPVTGTFNLKGSKLIKFEAGKSSGTIKPLAFKPTQITINTPLIRRLDLGDVSTLVGPIDLSNLTRLNTINLKGTGITSVKIPQSRTVETINLPAVTDIELAEVPNLSTFTIESVGNLKNITIGNNVGSGFDIVTLLSNCMSSNIKLNKLVITPNINITDLDHTIVEYIADIPEVSITGSIKVKGDLTSHTIHKLQSKFGDINNKSNSLYINYIKYNIASVTLISKKYFDEVGTYTLDYIINPSNGNDLKSMVWSINTNNYATINADTGEVTVNSIGTEEDKTKITVTLTLNLIDGSAITASKDVYVYKHTLHLGDIVFADGTYSNVLDSDKTPIGVCFYISDNLRLMCGLNDLDDNPWGLCSNSGYNGIPSITLADSSEDVYDTPMTNTEQRGLSDYHLIGNYVDTDGNFKDFDSSTALGQLGLVKITGDVYNKYSSYLSTLGYPSNDYIPYGLYNTIVIIAHRDVILKDSNVKLEVPKATDSKSEADVLNDLLTKITTDKGDAKYKQYYYPAASECYAYQPSVKEGEVLLDKFKAHHWWLPSNGELARLWYYYYCSYDAENNNSPKEGPNNIFIQAVNLGALKNFNKTGIYWSSTEFLVNYAWSIIFKKGWDMDRGIISDIKAIRPICSF